MAAWAEPGGGRAFRALLCSLVAASVSLTTARSLEVTGRSQSVESSRHRGGYGRELKGVYQVEACAWIRGGGFNTRNTGVCELHPQYGKLLLQNVHHPLKGELFEEGQCFISGKEACENKDFCSWLPVSADIPGRCIYKKAPQVAEECSSPGLESFASTLVECRDRRLDICTFQPECTVVGAENDRTRCGVVTSTALDLLIGSEIRQVELISALMEGAMYLNILDVPAYGRAPRTQAAVNGRRRLLQDDVLDFNPTSVVGPPVGIDGNEDRSDDGSLFGSRPNSSDDFGILPQDDKPPSLGGGKPRARPPTPPASSDPGQAQAQAPAPAPQEDDPEQKKPKERPKAAKTPSSKPKAPKSEATKAAPSPPMVPASPKGMASMTADTGFSANKANATVQGPPSQPSGKKGGKQATGGPTNDDDAGRPAGARPKGRVSVTAMTKMSEHNATAHEAPSAGGTVAPPGSLTAAGVPARGKADSAPADQKATVRSAPPGAAPDDDGEGPKVGGDGANGTLQDSPGLVESVAQTEGGDGAPQTFAGDNATDGSAARPPADDDGNLFSAGDDPDNRLTANGNAASPSTGSASGGRTSNADVQPLSVDGDSIGAAAPPSLLPNGPQYVFGVSADRNTGLGSGFTGKADDVLGTDDAKDGPDSEEAKALAAVVEILMDIGELLQLQNSSESGNKTELVLELATRLENLRYRLDATYTESSLSLWSKVDLWWWRSQHTLQDMEGASPEPLNLARTACTMAVVAEEVGTELSAVDMADERLRLDAPTATFASFAKGCGQGKGAEENGETTFGDLIEIVVSAVNESVHGLYPMRLNATFAAGLNQTWVEIVAQRSQLWNQIREDVSVFSRVGDYVGRTVRGMLQTLPFVAVPGDQLADAAGNSSPPVSAEDMDTGLRALDDLLDDLSGVTVAILEGNYTLASLKNAEDKRGLDDWQRGPVSAEDIRDAVEKAVENLRSHPVLIGNPQQRVKDGVVGIVHGIFNVMEATVALRNRQAADLAPPRVGGIILNVLSSVETLMEGWSGFEVQRGRIKASNIFGSPAAMKASLDLAGCLKLGGNDQAVCDTIDLPLSEARCVLREMPASARRSVSGQQPMVCMPPEAHQWSNLEKHLESVADDGTREKLAEGVSALFDAAAVCATRTEFDCAEDDMCNFTKTRTCELGPSFANRIVDNKNILGLGGKNNSCVEYLSRPKCALMSAREDCSVEDSKCFWRQPETRITEQGGGSPNATAGGEEGTRNGSVGGDAASSRPRGQNRTVGGRANETDGAGYCLDDWVRQMLGIVSNDGADALLEGKHNECQAQADAENCRVVDASLVELEAVGTATIPSGGPNISKVVALSVSVGGTLLFVAVMAVVWRVVRGRTKHAEGKLKKGEKKCSGVKKGCGGGKKGCSGKKGARRSFRLRLPSFLRFWLRRDGKGKRGKGCAKAGKKVKSEGKVPADDIRAWGQPAMMPPAPFVTTSIMIHDPDEQCSLQAKTKDLSDFSFVLGAIEPSGDSQHSGERVSSQEGRSRHLGPITSEIEPASETSSRSEDSDCESPWSGSEAWSDDEPEVPVAQDGWNPLPESLYRHK